MGRDASYPCASRNIAFFFFFFFAVSLETITAAAAARRWSVTYWRLENKRRVPVREEKAKSKCVFFFFFCKMALKSAGLKVLKTED